MDTLELADALNKAADLIDLKGLARGTVVDNQGHLCAWGAISTVITGEPHQGASSLRQGDREILHAVLNKDKIFSKTKFASNFPGDIPNIARFNDAAKSKTQVSSLLRRCAKAIQKESI